VNAEEGAATMNRLDKIEETQLKKNIPQFQPGDTVRVHVRIKESETKERLQAFEGVVIARKHGGARETITDAFAGPSFTICADCAVRQHAFANAIRAVSRTLMEARQ
jgi:hypothetical protein